MLVGVYIADGIMGRVAEEARSLAVYNREWEKEMWRGCREKGRGMK